TPASPAPATIATAVDLAGLDLTCEPRPGLLVPCYPDLVASVRDATGDVHATMSDALGGALTALFVDRELTAGGAPAALSITGARARALPAGDQAIARVELEARLVAPAP
ncbi:MAG TPA: hypothetical protein VHE35_09160, partial [Kofleriaceae bacterium]|nr:hypothetical protein [Kofleriaceae bacterium]